MDGSFSDSAHLFQPLQGGFRFLVRGQFDHFQIIGAKLAADGGKLAEGIARVLFQNAEGVATRDGGMLAGVAGEDEARAAITRQVEDLFHVFQAHGPGLIQDDDGAMVDPLRLRIHEQFLQRRGRLETVLAQHVSGGGRRRTEHGFIARRGHAVVQGAKRFGFARSGQAPQSGELIGAVQNQFDGPLLIDAERGRGAIAFIESRHRVLAGVHCLNQRQFRLQNLAGGIVAAHADEIRIPAQFCFEISQVNLPATFDQGGVQQLALRGDRVALEDMGGGVTESDLHVGVIVERFGRAVGVTADTLQRHLFEQADLIELALTDFLSRKRPSTCASGFYGRRARPRFWRACGPTPVPVWPPSHHAPGRVWKSG